MELLESYLCNRQQKCMVNGHLSEPAVLNCGVPQGSILGPLLFLLYSNDLPGCIKWSTPRMYADDTNISTTGNDLTEIVASANKDLETIREWLIAKNLILNVAKLEYMGIGSNYRVSKIAWDPQIKLGNNTLDK